MVNLHLIRGWLSIGIDLNINIPSFVLFGFSIMIITDEFRLLRIIILFGLIHTPHTTSPASFSNKRLEITQSDRAIILLGQKKPENSKSDRSIIRLRRGSNRLHVVEESGFWCG